MPPEPGIKRAAAFFDGQNLFHAARKVFGSRWPDYDVPALARAVCSRSGWQSVRIHFYTGVPSPGRDPRWSRFWSDKLLHLSRQGVKVFSRPLQYRRVAIARPDGTEQATSVAEEKGIDVRIALDVIRGAYHHEYDVAVIFSQDQDLSEVAQDVRTISREQHRWIKIASAYPVSPNSRNRRGITKTDWIPIDRAMYDGCIDRWDYGG